MKRCHDGDMSSLSWEHTGVLKEGAEDDDLAVQGCLSQENGCYMQ